jgi:hypothetical protein
MERELWAERLGIVGPEAQIYTLLTQPALR